MDLTRAGGYEVTVTKRTENREEKTKQKINLTLTFQGLRIKQEGQ